MNVLHLSKARDGGAAFILEGNTMSISGDFKYSAGNPCASLPQLMLLLKGELRLEILRCLAESPTSVSFLMDALKLEQSAVSHGLAALRQSGLVGATRNKKHRIYRISEDIGVHKEGQRLRLTLRCRNGDELIIRTTVLSAGHTASTGSEAMLPCA